MQHDASEFALAFLRGRGTTCHHSPGRAWREQLERARLEGKFHTAVVEHYGEHITSAHYRSLLREPGGTWQHTDDNVPAMVGGVWSAVLLVLACPGSRRPSAALGVAGPCTGGLS